MPGDRKDLEISEFEPFERQYFEVNLRLAFTRGKRINPNHIEYVNYNEFRNTLS